MAFSETVQAQLAGSVVTARFLVEMQFVSQTMRLSNGNASLKTADGRVWEGLRGLGTITGIERAVNGTAPQAVFALSGADPTVEEEDQADPSDYVNQPITVSMQFFSGGASWGLLDLPYALWGGTMQTVQETFAWDDSLKAWTSMVSLTAESWFSGRGQAPYSFYSDNDQQLRFPGDLGCEFMATLQYYVVRWPSY